VAEHAPQNVMDDPDEIARFHDRCSDFMRALLEALAATPDRPRTFPEVEDALGWPRRRIASVLGGVSRPPAVPLPRHASSSLRPLGAVDGQPPSAGGAQVFVTRKRPRSSLIWR
jgi:hypothetical protein